VEKRWIICIDVPIWVSALSNSQGDWTKLLSLLDDAAKPEHQLLYRDEIRQLAGDMPENIWVLYSKLSKMSTVAYPTDANASYVKSNPDVTAGIGNDGLKVELRNQMAYLYNRGYSVPRPIFAESRFVGDEIKLTKDGKNPRKVYVCGTGKGDILKRIDKLYPKLNQTKHFLFERKLGKGKVASTFSAYDKQKETPARDMLRDAFLHYYGEELPARSLWIKDDAHDCYVRFMHSGNNEYHGYDENDDTKVPEEVKKTTKY